MNHVIKYMEVFNRTIKCLPALPLLLVGVAVAPVATEAQPEASRPQAVAAYGKLPVSFEANHGQTDAQVRFLSRGNGSTFFLTPNEVVVSLEKSEAKTTGKAAPAGVKPDRTNTAQLRIELVGANRNPEIVGLDKLPGRINYFIGNDPKRWRTDVPTYAKVEFREVYPGVNMVFYGNNQRQLEFDFVVAPGAENKTVTLSFHGEDKLELDAQGNLVLHTGGKEIRFKKPSVYQQIDGVNKEIYASYVLNPESKLVGFEVAAYDASRPLVIDPVLEYSTYLGGASYDLPTGIAVDNSGNAYVVGNTQSSDFPTTTGAFQTSKKADFDFYITKLNSAGTGLIYSTFLGGSGQDFEGDIAVDSSGNAYVTGRTHSVDFPTTPGAFDTTYNGGSGDVFLTKLNSAGNDLLYSTFLGGTGEEGSGSLVIDNSGIIYTTGRTQSSDFPTTTGAYDETFNGVQDAFITKLNPAGNGPNDLIYSTFLGGTGFDVSENNSDIAIDSSGNIYVTGTTQSADFPITLGAFQTSLRGTSDNYVAKLNPAGNGPNDLIYSTYLGGSLREYDARIAVDKDANAYIAGRTNSFDLPTTPGAYLTSAPSIEPAFVTKLNPAGTGLVYSTFLGGTTRNALFVDIAVDSNGHAYVVGTTSASDFPTTPDAYSAYNGGGDVFLTKFNSAGSDLIYSTFIGGSLGDGPVSTNYHNIALDSSGNAYITSGTQSSDFPTTPGAFDEIGKAALNNDDAFVAKFSFAPLEVAIKIEQKSIKPGGNGKVTVDILTTENFDATNVDPTTVRFGASGNEAAPLQSQLKDIDRDRDRDLTLQFDIRATGIQCGDVSAYLTGQTFSGQLIQGVDSIKTVGCK